MIVLNPGNTKPIDYVYAYLSVDVKGNEGIISWHHQGVGMPLITSEEKNLPAMKEVIQALVRADPLMKVKLVKFTHVEVLEYVSKGEVM